MLTKEQRNFVYKEVAKRLKEQPTECYNGVCLELIYTCVKHKIILSLGFNIEKDFPEFFKHRPKGKDVNTLWWDRFNIHVRYEILLKCIEETK